MSYRCEGCWQVCYHTLLRHVILRPNKQIEREVPVCVSCMVELEQAVPLAAIQERFRSQAAQVVQSNCPAGAPSSLEENTGPPPSTRRPGGLTNGRAELKRVANLFDDRR